MEVSVYSVRRFITDVVSHKPKLKSGKEVSYKAWLRLLCLQVVLILSAITLKAQPGFTFNGVTQASPVSTTGGSNITISNKAFTNLAGDDIHLLNCNNITISNCYFGSSPLGSGVYLNNCTNVTITNCFFANNAMGANLVICNGPITITNNQFLNINGSGSLQVPHAILLNNCNGAGILVDHNYIEDFWAESNISDQINLFQSNGTGSSPIVISNNILRGGGPITSGTGIIAGDGGYSTNQNISGNKLVSTGSVGIGVASGQNITVNNNQIFGLPTSVSNVGAYFYNQYSSTCDNLNASGNKLNWLKSDGTASNFWSANNCSNANWDGSNTNGQSLASMNVPGYLFTVPIDTFWYIRKNGFSLTTFLGIGRPHSSAGSTQNISKTSTTLNGSGSYSSNGINYFWAEARGPSTATISNPNTANPTLSGLVNGTYHMRLVIADNGNGYGADTAYDVSWVDINVSGVGGTPNPPTVSAGSTQTIVLPTNSATLSGSATDASGNINYYAWTQLSGPNTATISNSSSLSTSVKGLVAGTYVFQLTVGDDNNLSASANVTIIVNAAIVPPTVSAGDAQTITLPANTVSLSATAANGSGNINAYAWTQVSGPNTATISNKTSLATSVKGLVAGTYVFKITVGDDNNASASSTVTITVNPALAPPVVNAGNAQTISLPTNTVTLKGSATDATGNLNYSAWTQLSGPNTATINTPELLTTSVTGLIEGTYVFQLIVGDDNNLSGSATVTITVNPVLVPPVVSAGNSQTITLPTNTVTLKGTASDATGTITAYAWTQVSGPNTATISSAAALNTSVKALVAGTYVFKLTVTDSYNLSSSATVTVIVNAAPNLAPNANAGANQTITLPVNTVTVSGASSNDPDGSVVAYKWIKIAGPSGGTIASSTSATTAINNLAAGTYSYQLTVTDNSGATDADTVTITVNPAVNQPPLANAGSSKTITLPANTATLDGSGSSDPDGTIASYVWKQVSGPSTATISSTSTTAISVSGLIAGQYVFQLTVTDNSGATATAQVKVIVNPAPVNQSPVANAGANQTITLPVNSVTVNGSASFDPDGTIAVYKWVKIAGPTGGSIANTGAATTLINSLTAGTYSYQLTVTDNSGATDEDTVTIIVNPAVNQLPVANAGSSKTITLPVNSVTLDGSKSSDPDGSIVSYAWTQVSGPSTATISSNNTATATASALVAGQYAFLLTVTDNSGAKATAQVKIIVNPAAVPVNPVPVANAGSNQSVTLPINTVTLDGSASQDPNGLIASYAWIKVNGPAQGTIVSPASAVTVVNNLAAGTYTFRLTVTDTSGTTNADTVTVIVNKATNQSPVANGGSNQTITLPVSSVSLNGANSYDPDGTIVSYAWTEVSGPSSASISNAGAVTATAGGLQAGVYYFQLTVTDNSGASNTAEIKVTVRAAANQPPVANAGASQVITLPVNSVTLNATGSVDHDGTITSYAWVKASGPSQGTIVSSGNAITVVNNLVQGVYTFTLTVKDNSGATSTDTISVTVNPAPNQAPVANAGASQTLTLPDDSAALDGSQSYDPDGSIAAYKWTEVSGPTTAVITSGNTANPVVSGLVAGQYIFQLAVTDNKGTTSFAQVKIAVDVPVNQAPVANAGTDVSITLPVNSVTLDGSKSYDPDGRIVAYSWNKISGSGAITMTNSNTAKPYVTGLQAGIYIFQLTVTDNTGAVSTDNVTITVNSAVAANLAPVANAGADQTITLPTSTVVLDGTKSTDADGTITAYSWSKLSGTGGTIVQADGSRTTISGLQAGVYIFQLLVTDNKGATAADRVTITVNAAAAAVIVANLPPVANAGNDTSISLPATTAALNGSASADPDGTIETYAWTQLTGPDTATIAAPASAISNVYGLSVGVYTFRLVVTDNKGATGADTVTITVSDNLRSAESLLLYPNPAASNINLRLISDSTGNMKVNIYDMSGKMVMTSEMSKPQSFFNQSLNISQLAHGMYTMQIIIGTHKSMISKFLKQ